MPCWLSGDGLVKVLEHQDLFPLACPPIHYCIVRITPPGCLRPLGSVVLEMCLISAEFIHSHRWIKQIYLTRSHFLLQSPATLSTFNVYVKPGAVIGLSHSLTVTRTAKCRYLQAATSPLRIQSRGLLLHLVPPSTSPCPASLYCAV